MYYNTCANVLGAFQRIFALLWFAAAESTLYLHRIIYEIYFTNGDETNFQVNNSFTILLYM